MVLAVGYGIPSFLFLAAGLVWLLVKLGDRRELDQKTSNLRMGMVISLIGLFTAIASVHLWNSTYCWMRFLIGSSVWMLEQGRGKKEIMAEIQAKKLEQQRIDRENARKQRLAAKGASGV